MGSSDALFTFSTLDSSDLAGQGQLPENVMGIWASSWC